MSITPNVILEIASLNTPYQPVLQVLEIRTIAMASAATSQAERYKLKLSDGTHFMQAMLTTNHNHMIYDGSLQENGLIRLDEYVCNTVQEKRICIIVNLAVVAPPLPYGKAGNPVSIDAVGPLSSVGAAPKPEAGYGGAPSAASSGGGGGGGYGAGAGAGGGYGAGAGRGGGGYGSVVATSSATPNHVPIASLNPYSSRWTVKVRVTNKGDRRTWSNARGDGSLFSCDLLDQYGTQIRATFFKEGVDKFFDVIHKDSVYFMSGGKLKAANKQYSSIPNEYELSFDGNSSVMPAGEDTGIKRVQYAFVSIAALEHQAKDALVDVVGVMKEITPANAFTSRAGKELVKREVTLVDTSAVSVSMTLWGEKSAMITEDLVGSVLAVRGARVGDFGGGKNLSAVMSSSMDVNLDIPEVRKLRQWWDSEGSGVAVTTLSGGGGGGAGGSGPTVNVAARRTFSSAKAEDSDEVFTVKGTLTQLKHEGDKVPWYPSCTQPKCQKKAVQTMSGTDWHCEKCNLSFPQPNYRYILSITGADHTGAEWMTAFNDQAQMMLDNTTAGELARLREEGDAGMSQWNAIFQRANFKQYMFRLRAKHEVVNEQDRLKMTIVAIKPVEYAKEARALLEAIKLYG